MNRSSRVRMEAWRQWPLGGRKKRCFTKRKQNRLDSDRPSHGRPVHSKPFKPYLVSGLATAQTVCRNFNPAAWEAVVMGKQRSKPNYRRRVLRLPDLDHCKT